MRSSALPILLSVLLYAFAYMLLSSGHRLDQLEKEKGIKTDPVLDAFVQNLRYGHKTNSIMVEVVSKVLGLDVCIDTVCGNDLLKVRPRLRSLEH